MIIRDSTGVVVGGICSVLENVDSSELVEFQAGRAPVGRSEHTVDWLNVRNLHCFSFFAFDKLFSHTN